MNNPQIESMVIENLLAEHRDTQVYLELLENENKPKDVMYAKKRGILESFVNLLSLSKDLEEEEIIEAVEKFLLSNINNVKL